MERYTYYIYLIQGIKIGCTTEIEKRMADQGFTEWEILWQREGDYDFGWIAGEKEIELQKLYGYPVDNSNYQVSRMNRRQSFENCSKGGKKGGLIAGRIAIETGQYYEMCSIGGKKGGATTRDSGKLMIATRAAVNSPNNINKQKWLCPNGHVTSAAWKERYCIKHNLDINLCTRIN